VGLATLIRAALLSLCIFLIILLATACRTPADPSSPVKDAVQSTSTQAIRTATPAELLLTKPPAEIPTAAFTQAAVSPTSALPPTLTAPAILTPSIISALEQIGLIEYAAWDLVLAAAWSPSSDLIAVAAGESIYIYTNELEQQGKLDVGDWTTSLAFHPDGSWLASGGRDGLLRIWDVDKQDLILEAEAHKKGVNAVAFSPDGRVLATAGNDAVARLWDPVTGERLAQMIGGTYAVPSIAFSRDGTNLAITNGGLIRIRDVESSRFAYTLSSEVTNYSIARSPDGNLLAAGSTAGNIHLWDLSSGASPDPIPLLAEPGDAPSSLIWSVAFSPDGGLLAAGDNDGKIFFWDVRERKFLTSRATGSRGITSLAFSPDGRHLITGGLDGVLRLWAAR
jgi:WD40 repeat protein